MTQIVILNLVFFVPATCGAAVSAWLVLHFLRAPAPPNDGEGGTGVAARDLPRAGPDDLARSA
ncbi:MAG TPA: hypothetical protein VJQ85_02020 [Gaiellaceae bacterium]|nr:hypothetical protein [Gaiellaceae bacterium]